MGCDGGTIPRRDELVKVKKRPEQKDKESELVFKWRHCAMTQEALEHPILTCWLGRLYNAQSMLQGLLSKNLPESCSHIKSMKDLKQLNLTKNPAYKPSNDVEDTKVSPYMCPISRVEMTGRFRFICLWNCGCVFSERAFKEFKTNQCVVCQKVYTENDVIVLNGTENDIITMMERQKVRKMKSQAEKKEKKKSKASATATSSDLKESKEQKCDEKDVKKEKKVTNGAGPSTSNKLKREAVDLKPIHDPMFKKAKGEYSVAKDPNATEVFKSIFTSHSDEKQQDRAHWVTYNPFYN